MTRKAKSLETYRLRAECGNGAYATLAIMAKSKKEAVQKAHPLAARNNMKIVRVSEVHLWEEWLQTQKEAQNILFDESKPPVHKNYG